METFLLSIPATPPAASSSAGELNPLKHHQQVRCGDLRTVAQLARQLEPTTFQTLVPNPKTRPIERQNLQTISTPIPEHE
jgi:hypothetical protein